MMSGGQTHRCREDRVRTESLPDPQAQEARALRWSAGTGVALALLGVGWGLLARSQIILFDGVYAVLGTILSWLSLRASAVVAAGPTPRYPFGREALAPLVVAASALVLLGTFGYACVDAVLVILSGGGETSIGAAFGYSVVSLVVVVALRAALARRRADSDLVAAEVEQWGAAAVLGVAMVVGFGIAVVLDRTGWAFLAPYVDPALVLVAAALVLPTPVGMLRTSFRELLEGVPDPEVTEPIHEAVRDLRSESACPNRSAGSASSAARSMSSSTSSSTRTAPGPCRTPIDFAAASSSGCAGPAGCYG